MQRGISHRPPTGFLGCLQARTANPLSAKQHGRLRHCCCCRDPAAAGFPTATVLLWCRVQAKRGADSHLCISRPKSQPPRLQKLFEMQLLGSPYAAPMLRRSVLPDSDAVKGTKSWETPNRPQSRGFVSSQGRIQPRQKRWKCSLLDLLLHRSHASPLPTSIGGLCHIIPNSNRSCKPHGIKAGSCFRQQRSSLCSQPRSKGMASTGNTGGTQVAALDQSWHRLR